MQEQQPTRLLGQAGHVVLPTPSLVPLWIGGRSSHVLFSVRTLINAPILHCTPAHSNAEYVRSLCEGEEGHVPAVRPSEYRYLVHVDLLSSLSNILNGFHLVQYLDLGDTLNSYCTIIQYQLMRATCPILCLIAPSNCRPRPQLPVLSVIRTDKP